MYLDVFVPAFYDLSFIMDSSDSENELSFSPDFEMEAAHSAAEADQPVQADQPVPDDQPIVQDDQPVAQDDPPPVAYILPSAFLARVLMNV